jgi:hypothetical protein
MPACGTFATCQFIHLPTGFWGKSAEARASQNWRRLADNRYRAIN